MSDLQLTKAPGFSELAYCGQAAFTRAIGRYYAGCQQSAAPSTYIDCLCNQQYATLTSQISRYVGYYDGCSIPHANSAITVLSGYCQANANGELFEAVVTVPSFGPESRPTSAPGATTADTTPITSSLTTLRTSRTRPASVSSIVTETSIQTKTTNTSPGNFTSPEARQHKAPLSTVAIVGIGIGSVVVALLLTSLATCCILRYRRNRMIGPGYGLTKIGDPEDALVDVIFIHGLGGHSHGTWTEPRHRVFWPGSDQFWTFDQLRRARRFTFGYNADVFGQSQMDIGTICSTLSNALYPHRTGGLAQRPVIFVAHSLGGIIAKKFVTSATANPNQYRHAAEMVKGIIFYGTPHQGANIAAIADDLVGAVKIVSFGIFGQSRLVRYLKRNSMILRDIARDFARHADRMEIRSFIEELPTKGTLVVDQNSGTMGTANELFAAAQGANHVNMCRYSSADGNDNNFRVAESWLNDLIRKALGME